MMQDPVTPPKLDIASLTRFWVPPDQIEPRPPYQTRGGTHLYFGGTVDRPAAQALLTPAAAPAPTRLPGGLSRPALTNPLAPVMIPLPSGGELIARAFPIALRMGQGPLSLVLLTDPRAPGPTDPEPLLRLMGLTPAEAVLAALIGQGLPPAEAARRRGVTQATARSMLKVIFAKLGIGRQAELARLVARLETA
jgi:DNA-binding CsgD family transcriptional regulator